MDWKHILRRRRVASRAFHDIVAKPRQRVVRLRERSWKLEVSASSVAAALRRHWVRSGVAALLVLALAVGLLRGVGRANVATLYATSCLGGWANPQLAEGKPDVPPDGDPELFTAKNSAVLDGALAQVYCGSFRGDVPTDAVPKKVELQLSWAVVPPKLSPELKPLPGGGGQVVPEVLNVDVQATPEQQVQAVLEAPDSQALQVAEPVAEPAPAAEPAPTPEVSGLPFVPVARAQEEDSPAAPQLQAEPATPEPVPTVAEQPSVEQPLGVPEATPAPEATTSAEQPLPEQPIAPADTEPPFLEVSYTVDGKVWTELVSVTAASWRGLSVELPLQSWEELGVLQVSLQAVPTVAEQPQVLLDSVYLAVTYGTDAANVQNQPDFNRDTVLQLQADGEVNLVRVFSASRQRQQLWTYQAAGDGTWTLVAEEPELDPVAGALLRSQTAIWVSAGGGAIMATPLGGGSVSGRTIEPEGATDMPLADGSVARWDGYSLSLLNQDGSAAEPARSKDGAAFLAELRGPGTVAATTTAPIEQASPSDLQLPSDVSVEQVPPADASSTQPAAAQPPEQPIFTAE